MTLERMAELMNRIKEKGLKAEFRKHAAYFYRLKRKGTITENEFLQAFDSTLITLGN